MLSLGPGHNGDPAGGPGSRGFYRPQRVPSLLAETVCCWSGGLWHGGGAVPPRRPEARLARGGGAAQLSGELMGQVARAGPAGQLADSPLALATVADATTAPPAAACN